MKSSIKWAIVVIITPNLVSILKIIVLFDCAKKISKIYCSHCFSIVFYCFLLFSIVFTDNDIFIIFLEFNHQNKYSDQISCPYLHFYGNYEPLLFEPILVQNDVILAQNDS